MFNFLLIFSIVVKELGDCISFSLPLGTLAEVKHENYLCKGQGLTSSDIEIIRSY